MLVKRNESGLAVTISKTACKTLSPTDGLFRSASQAFIGHRVLS